MKKTLIALAALAVVSAASAQTSSVTLYGLIDESISSQKDSSSLPAGVGPVGDSTKNSVKPGILNGTRIGFKGTEDLGAGLKANFVIEFGLDADEASTLTTNRQSFVGLSGDFGAVTIGTQYTPYYNVLGALDQYGVITAPGLVAAAHVLGGPRRNNAVQYVSPSISGFQGTVQVANGTEQSTLSVTPAGKSFGASLVYAAGPLVAGVIYDDVTAPGATLVKYSTVTGDALGANGLALFGDARSSETSVWAVGGLYDFTVAKASLAYTSLTDKHIAGGNDRTSKGYNVSVSVPFGAVTAIGNLGRADVVENGGANALDAVLTGYQLGANYSLSKRTTAYALYGSDTLTVNGATGEQKRTQTSVGIRHTF